MCTAYKSTGHPRRELMSPGRKSAWWVATTLPDSGIRANNERGRERGRERRVLCPLPGFGTKNVRYRSRGDNAERKTTSTETGYLYSGKEEQQSNDQAECAWEVPIPGIEPGTSLHYEHQY